MARFRTLLLSVCIMMLCAATYSQAQLSANYFFAAQTKKPYIVMSGATTLRNGQGGGGLRDAGNSGLSIGFTFPFNGTNYTTFSVSTNGVLGLGSTAITTSSGNSLTGSNMYPTIAPFWDGIRLSGGGYNGCLKAKVQYMTTGSAPNRILVVEWTDVVLQSYNYEGVAGTFQVRLYENGKIEFYYLKIAGCDKCSYGWGCPGTSASIGIAAGNTSGNFLSVTPGSSGAATVSSSSVNNSVNLSSTGQLPDSTLYIFLPATACNLAVTGRTGAGNGGTAAMANGDSLFKGFTVQLGSQANYKPFNAQFGDPICGGSYTMTITGAAASDYYFTTPGTQTKTVSIPSGAIDSSIITFKPSSTGMRYAQMLVTGQSFSRTYSLVAGGYSLFTTTGTVAQGAPSTTPNCGDTLMKTIVIPRLTTGTYTPLTLTNIYVGAAAPMAVTYTISNDPLGQYTVSTGGPFGSTASASVPTNGGTSTPQIRFAPTGVGFQNATLTVSVDGVYNCAYPLKAFSAAPGAEFLITGSYSNVRGLGTNGAIVPTSELFYFDYRCAGENVSSIPVTLNSTGSLPFQITNIQFRLLDTTVAQGTGPYPATSTLINDYAFSTTQGVAPLSANTPITLPLTAAGGTQQTLYLNFVPQRTGKRYARAFIYTNGQNFSGVDPTGATILGLLVFDVYGRGNGATPATFGNTKLLSIVCPDTRVRDTAQVWAKITNTGQCDLRIDSKKFEIFSGDVDPQPREFTIVTPFASPKDASGKYVIAPGGVDSLLLSFHPIQVGSRRAWIRLQTNDSNFTTNGNTERGAYYWDVIGNGTSNLGITLIKDGNSVFPPGVIDGSPLEKSIGIAELRNTLNGAITVTSITITGPDAADFTIDASTPLPTLPKLMTPAELLRLSLLFKPASGSQPGMRTAYLQVVLDNGDTIRTLLSAEAGTRVLSANPASLFDTEIVPVGQLLRRTVEVKNTGTLPLTLSSVMITGADSLAYSITPMARNILIGGQTEYVEVTFKPVAAGTTVAKFEAAGNQTNGMQSVTLGGKGVRTKGKVDPSGVTSQGVGGGIRMGLEERVNSALPQDNPDLKFKK